MVNINNLVERMEKLIQKIYELRRETKKLSMKSKVISITVDPVTEMMLRDYFYKENIHRIFLKEGMVDEIFGIKIKVSND